MKAKEYADKYISEGKTNDALASVWIGMFNEFKEIAEKRHTSTDEAAYSIFKELDQKWRAFARFFEGEVKPDGFRNVIERRMPNLYSEIVKIERRLP